MAMMNKTLLLAVLAIIPFSANALNGKIQSVDNDKRQGVIKDDTGGTIPFYGSPGGIVLKVGDKVDYMVTRGMEDNSTRAMILSVNGVAPGLKPATTEPLGTMKSWDADKKRGVMTDPQGVNYDVYYMMGEKPLDLHVGDKVKFISQSAYGTRRALIVSIVPPPQQSMPAPRGRQTAKPKH